MRSKHMVLLPLAICTLALSPFAAGVCPGQRLLAQPATAPTRGAPQPAGTPRVRSGFLVQPDTVAVGDPFRLVVSVVVPDGARVEWAAIDDTSATVSMRGSVRVQSVPDGVSRRETATYELAAWDIGALRVGVPDATVRIGDATLKVPLSDAMVFVATVLPGDTTMHVPKPAKGLFQRVVPWWERWWPALLVLAALGLLWWYMKRRRKAVALQQASPLDIYVRAMGDFDRLERLALADAGERGRAVALAVEILRVYLVSRVPGTALSLTTSELLARTHGDARVPEEALSSLLWAADGIKFARHSIPGARATELTAMARDIVERVEVAHRAAIAAEEARRLAAERAVREEKSSDEEDARRRSRRKAGVS
ncbi:MAG TPA: hypothetical protein VE869_08545 [Gemmatimonas sp.]|nr:hypothetical protein [Gemmatimonas sp.]